MAGNSPRPMPPLPGPRQWLPREPTGSTSAANRPAPAPHALRAEEQIRRVLPVLRSLREPDADAHFHRHHLGARRRGGARCRARRSSTIFLPAAMIPPCFPLVARRGVAAHPHAHAGRAGDDAGRPSLPGCHAGSPSRSYLQRREPPLRPASSARRILLDPGIGFGKTVAHNLTLLRAWRRSNHLAIRWFSAQAARNSSPTVTGEPIQHEFSAPLPRSHGASQTEPTWCVSMMLRRCLKWSVWSGDTEWEALIRHVPAVCIAVESLSVPATVSHLGRASARAGDPAGYSGSEMEATLADRYSQQ